LTRYYGTCSLAAALDQRGRLLRAALGFAGLPRPSYDRAFWALRTWLDSWSGIGHVAIGMHRQGDTLWFVSEIDYGGDLRDASDVDRVIGDAYANFRKATNQ
jgi:hypothetical protein